MTGERVKRRWWGAALIVACWVPAVALGQDDGAGMPAPDPEAGVAPEEEVVGPLPPGPEDEARARFVQGLALARDGNCVGAITEFEASYALVPRPNTLYNIAQCQETLNRYDLAVRYYDQYLETAPADAEDRPTVEASMRALTNLLGIIVVRSNVQAEVWAGGRIVGEAPGEVPIPGGRHRIEVRRDGYIPAVREVEVAARQRVEIEVELEEPQQTTIEQTTIEQTNIQNTTVVEDRGIAPTLFYTGVGLTAATLAVGTAFGVRAMIRRGDQRDVNPLATDERLRLRGEAQDSARLADVFFITGGVLAVGTIIVFFLTDFGGDDDDPADGSGEDGDDGEAEAASARLAPFFAPGTGGLMLDGRF